MSRGVSVAFGRCPVLAVALMPTTKVSSDKAEQRQDISAPPPPFQTWPNPLCPALSLTLEL